MKRTFLLIFFIYVFGQIAWAQNFPDYQRTKVKGNETQVDARLRAGRTFYLPKFLTPSLNGGKDSVGAVGYNTADSSMYVYRGGGSWVKVGSGGNFAPVSPSGDYIYATPSTPQNANINLSGNGLTAGRIGATTIIGNSVIATNFNLGTSLFAEIDGSNDLRMGNIFNYSYFRGGFKLFNSDGLAFQHNYYASSSEFYEPLFSKELTIRDLSGVGDRTIGVDANGKIKVFSSGGGSAVYASNGLTKEVDTVKFGGTLQKATSLDLNGKDLTIANTSSFNNSSLLLTQGAAVLNYFGGANSANFNASNDKVGMTLGAFQDFSISTEGYILKDMPLGNPGKGINLRGVDFANFQDSSLVTKKWVVDNFTSGGGGSIFKNGLVKNADTVGLGGTGIWDYDAYAKIGNDVKSTLALTPNSVYLSGPNSNSNLFLNNGNAEIQALNPIDASSQSALNLTPYGAGMNTFNGDAFSSISNNTYPGNIAQVGLTASNPTGANGIVFSTNQGNFIEDSVFKKGLRLYNDYSKTWTLADSNYLAPKRYVDSVAALGGGGLALKPASPLYLDGDSLRIGNGNTYSGGINLGDGNQGTMSLDNTNAFLGVSSADGYAFTGNQVKPGANVVRSSIGIINSLDKTSEIVIDNTKGIVLRDSVFSKGAYYSQPYHLNWLTADSLVLANKAYVDKAVVAGVTANNGITKTGNNFSLGGSLSSGVLINTNGNAFFVGEPSGIGGGITSAPSVATIGITNGGVYKNSLIFSDAGGITFNDNISLKGPVAGGNYEVNYVPLSYTSKKYVDSVAAAVGSSGVPSSRLVSTGYGLTGGGDLSINRTHSADTTSAGALVSKTRLANAIALYQKSINVTTTGTSGPATLIGNTLNIPNYATGSSISGLTTNYLPKASSATTIANSRIFDNGTNVGIGTASPAYALDVNGGAVNGVGRFTSSGGAASFRLNNTTPTLGREYNFGSDDIGHFFIYNETLGKYVLDIDINGKWIIGETAQPVNIPSLNASSLVKTNSSKDLVSAVSGADFVAPATTVAGFPLSGNVTLANLTATNASLTFSGTYNGSTARNIGLNLGNANTWTAQQSGTTPTAKDNTTKFATTAFVGKQFTATASGNGASLAIVIAHGVSGITSANSVIVGANNAAASGINWYSIDATNVTINYTVAPATGTNNLLYSISIK